MKKCESGEAWLYIDDKRGGWGKKRERERTDEQASERTSERKREREREISRIPLRGWESVLNTCFPYRIHFEPQSAVALMPAWRSLLHVRPLPRRRASRGRKRREKGHWFISFLNNSLLFSSSLSRSRLPFDLSLSTCRRRFIFIYDLTPPPGDEIHRLSHCPLPPAILLSCSWFVQLFAILFPLVEIIGGASRWRSVYAE